MEKLAILDCGGQYTKVIDRKVRELGVYSDIFPMGVSADKLRGYDAMILSGGPSSVWESGAPAYDPAIFELGIPTLGICYGMQLINEHFGGIVLPEVKTEYGPTEIDIIAPCPLTDGMDKKQTVLMSHGDAVKKHADGFVTFAVTGDVVAGIYNAERKIIGVQFRNLATVGASVASRYGFSDVITPLLACGARVRLHEQGELSLEAFLRAPRRRDVLTEIILPKAGGAGAFCNFRASTGDFSILNVAALRRENTWRLAVGARPHCAALAYKAMEQLDGGAEADLAARTAAEELSFAGNMRASAEYRQALCQTLCARVLREVEK